MQIILFIAAVSSNAVNKNMIARDSHSYVYSVLRSDSKYTFDSDTN